MKLKKFVNEHSVYLKVEKEIKEWIETTYNGLSIDFYPHLEIVRTNNLIDYPEYQVAKIIEVVNVKIGSILESHAEEIYIAERLQRIWRNHPKFNIEIESLEDIKQNPMFLRYLKELIILPNTIKEDVNGQRK